VVFQHAIYNQTSSPGLDKVLKKWERDESASAENCQQLAYIILVELLAYQFASPICWIKVSSFLPLLERPKYPASGVEAKAQMVVSKVEEEEEGGLRQPV